MMCEICESHSACGIYRIKDSHILDNGNTIRALCGYCVHDLKQHGVHLERLKGIDPRNLDDFQLQSKLIE